jgi:hypothetical protein
MDQGISAFRRKKRHWWVETRVKDLYEMSRGNRGRIQAEFTANHELGHVLHETMKTRGYSRKWAVKWENAYKKNNGGLSLSTYAQTNVNEGFAEAYTWYINRDKIGDPIPQWVKDYFDELFGWLQTV